MDQNEELGTFFKIMDDVREKIETIYTIHIDVANKLGIRSIEELIHHKAVSIIDQHLQTLEANGVKGKDLNPTKHFSFAALLMRWYIRSGSLYNGNFDLLSERECSLFIAAYMMGIYRGVIYGHEKDKALEYLEDTFHADKCGKVRKKGHQVDNVEKHSVVEPFEKYVHTRLLNGFKGSAPALVDHALKLPQFKNLKDAVKTTYTESGSTKRAFIKKRTLEDIVRKKKKEIAPQ